MSERTHYGDQQTCAANILYIKFPEHIQFSIPSIPQIQSQQLKSINACETRTQLLNGYRFSNVNMYNTFVMPNLVAASWPYLLLNLVKTADPKLIQCATTQLAKSILGYSRKVYTYEQECATTTTSGCKELCGKKINESA